MKIKGYLWGLISCFIGFMILVIAIDLISKPSNTTLKFNYKESFDTYFFSFSYALGNMGHILSIILLTIYFGLFFILGYAIYKTTRHNH